MKYSSLKIATTGLDKNKDHLLRIVIIEFEVDDTLKPYQSQVVNEVDVFIKPPCDFEVDEMWNNFTKQDVLDMGYSFTKNVADRLATYIEGKNITGFNVDGFDLAFLYEYYKRYNYNLDLSNTRTFDTMYMDMLLYPRNFEGIYKRYTGQVMSDDMRKDVLTVAKNNVDIFGIEFIQSREQGLLSGVGNPVLSPEHFVEMKDNKLVFCNGKYQYKDVLDICYSDPQYIKWIFTFASDITKNTIKEYFNKNVKKS